MGFLTGSYLIDFVGILVALAAAFYTWINSRYTYWSKRGLLHLEPEFFFGNSKNIMFRTEPFASVSSRTYEFLKIKRQKHGGFYNLFQPVYVPLDPDIVKRILQTDFSYFVNRGMYYNEEDDPLSAHLFSLKDERWRNLRIKLTPTFTSGRMKMMFETLVKVGDQLVEEMDRNAVASNKSSLEMKDILSRYTTDVIVNCAFGVDCNCLDDPQNEFNQKGKLFFRDEDRVRNVLQGLTFVMPKVMLFFRTLMINPKLSKFFIDAMKETVEYREKNNVYRKDFMHLLLQLKNRGTLSDDGKVLAEDGKKKSGDVTLSFNEVAAQAFLFYLAGFDTSSTTMTFCLLELVQNPEIQDKVRAEVEEVLERYNGKITYEAIQDMAYMEKVVHETLRKYPPFAVNGRVCNKDYKVPGYDLVIEKGTTVHIPTYALQHDPDYFPEPEKFDPERFSEENKKKRPDFTYLPFGEGPRVCIGLRFGIMQTKVGLAMLLKNYKFSLGSKMELPVKIDPQSIILAVDGGLWLDYQKL